jgi:hypothetical protein
MWAAVMAVLYSYYRHAGKRKHNSRAVPLSHAHFKRYTEAVPILYTRNIFDFDSLESLIAFSCTILPKRLDSIRHLRFDLHFQFSLYFSENTPYSDWPRWERTWRIISTMTRLRDLRANITWSRPSLSPREERRLLDPLRQVNGLDVFEVTIPQVGVGIAVKPREDAEFKIIRAA